MKEYHTFQLLRDWVQRNNFDHLVIGACGNEISTETPVDAVDGALVDIAFGPENLVGWFTTLVTVDLFSDRVYS